MLDGLLLSSCRETKEIFQDTTHTAVIGDLVDGHLMESFHSNQCSGHTFLRQWIVNKSITMLHFLILKKKKKESINIKIDNGKEKLSYLINLQLLESYIDYFTI